MHSHVYDSGVRWQTAGPPYLWIKLFCSCGESKTFDKNMLFPQKDQEYPDLLDSKDIRKFIERPYKIEVKEN